MKIPTRLLALALVGPAGAGTAVEAQQYVMKACGPAPVCSGAGPAACAQKKYRADWCLATNNNMDEVAIKVYDSTQMDERLRGLDATISTKEGELSNAQNQLRNDVESKIIDALRSLPPQLFSQEVQDRLRDELTETLGAQLSEMKIEIKEELKAELLRELTSLKDESP